MNRRRVLKKSQGKRHFERGNVLKLASVKLDGSVEIQFLPFERKIH